MYLKIPEISLQEKKLNEFDPFLYKFISISI